MERLGGHGRFDGLVWRSERSLGVEVGNQMLAEALVAAARRHGWHPASPRSTPAIVVADRPPTRPTSVASRHTVLVCDPTPFDARLALDALCRLSISSVVLSDDPADLAPALDAFEGCRVSLPARVLSLAGQMPALTERQTEVLGAVVSGESNADVAYRFFLSLATVKREVAALYGALDAPSRSALVAAARDLGVPPATLPQRLTG